MLCACSQLSVSYYSQDRLIYQWSLHYDFLLSVVLLLIISLFLYVFEMQFLCFFTERTTSKVLSVRSVMSSWHILRTESTITTTIKTVPVMPLLLKI